MIEIQGIFLAVILTQFGKNQPEKPIIYPMTTWSSCFDKGKIELSKIDNSKFKKVELLCCERATCFPVTN